MGSIPSDLGLESQGRDLEVYTFSQFSGDAHWGWSTEHILRNTTRESLAVISFPRKFSKQNVQIAYCAQKCTLMRVCIYAYKHTHTQRVHRSLILSNATSWLTFQHKLVVKCIPRKLHKFSCYTWIWARSQLKLPGLFHMCCPWVIDLKKHTFTHRTLHLFLLFSTHDSIWLAGLTPCDWGHVPTTLNSWIHKGHSSL